MTSSSPHPSVEVSVPHGTPSGLSPSPPSRAVRTIVDVHTHLWKSVDQLGPEAAKRIRDQSIGQPWDQPDTSEQAFDQAMEPVEYAIVLGLECGHVDASIPFQQVAQYVARDPGKYLGFAGIDPMTSGYLSNVDQAVQLGLVGVVVSPLWVGFTPVIPVRCVCMSGVRRKSCRWWFIPERISPVPRS